MKERFTFTAEDTGIQVKVLDNVAHTLPPSLVTAWIPDNFARPCANNRDDIAFLQRQAEQLQFFYRACRTEKLAIF